MKPILSALVAIASMAAPAMASAQTTPMASAAARQGTIETARKLVALAHVSDMYERMFTPLTPIMVAAIVPAMAQDTTVSPQIRAELATTAGKARIGKIVGDEMMAAFRARYPDLLEQTAKEYAAAFTEDELSAIVAFYSSGPGAKALVLLPVLAAKMSDYGKQVGREAGAAAYQKILRRLDTKTVS